MKKYLKNVPYEVGAKIRSGLSKVGADLGTKGMKGVNDISYKRKLDIRNEGVQRAIKKGEKLKK